jgi:hypothetical protein
LRLCARAVSRAVARMVCAAARLRSDIGAPGFLRAGVPLD